MTKHATIPRSSFTTNVIFNKLDSFFLKIILFFKLEVIHLPKLFVDRPSSALFRVAFESTKYKALDDKKYERKRIINEKNTTKEPTIQLRLVRNYYTEVFASSTTFVKSHRFKCTIALFFNYSTDLSIFNRFLGNLVRFSTFILRPGVSSTKLKVNIQNFILKKGKILLLIFSIYQWSTHIKKTINTLKPLHKKIIFKSPRTSFTKWMIKTIALRKTSGNFSCIATQFNWSNPIKRVLLHLKINTPFDLLQNVSCFPPKITLKLNTII